MNVSIPPLFGLLTVLCLGPGAAWDSEPPIAASESHKLVHRRGKQQNPTGPLVMAGHVPERMTVYADSEEPSAIAQRLRQSTLAGQLPSKILRDLSPLLTYLSDADIQHAGLGFDFSFMRQKASYVLLLATDHPKQLVQTLRGMAKGVGGYVFRTGMFVAIADSAATQRAVRRCALGEAKALVDTPGFRSFLTSEPTSALRFRADLNRLFPIRPGLAAPKDAGSALVASHVLWMAGRGRIIEGSLELKNGIRLEINTSMPRLPEARRFIEAKTTPLPPLAIGSKNALRATLTRDLGSFWDNVDTLLPEAARPGLAEFRSTASLLLGGLAVDDFLAGLGHGIEFHVGELPSEHSAVRHRFPTAAIVMELKDERMRTELMISFQEVIGAINLQASMDGQPRYLLGSKEHPSGLMLTAKFLPALLPDKNDDRKQVEITMAQVGARVIVGSHSSIVAALADSAISSKVAKRTLGDHIHMDAQSALALIEDAHSFLVGRLSLEIPGGRDAAQKVVDTAKAILRTSKSLDFRVTALGEKARILLDIKAPAWWQRLQVSEEKK